MAGQVVLVDTSVLIEYFRKTDKARTLLHRMAHEGYVFHISFITEYEVYVGATESQLNYWEQLLQRVDVLPLRSQEVRRAVNMQTALKRRRKQLALPDLFIAATALEASLPLATLNRKHFESLPDLRLFE